MRTDIKDEVVCELLNIIDKLFGDIRGDWSDPRWECREGYEAVAHLKEYCFGDAVGYRHEEGRTLDKFLEDHRKRKLEEKESW